MLCLIVSDPSDQLFLASYRCCALVSKTLGTSHLVESHHNLGEMLASYVQLARVGVVCTIASITVLQVLTADRANNIATFAEGRAHEAALVTMWGFIACCTANLSLIWILGVNW